MSLNRSPTNVDNEIWWDTKTGGPYQQKYGFQNYVGGNPWNSMPTDLPLQQIGCWQQAVGNRMSEAVQQFGIPEVTVSTAKYLQ